MSDDIQHIDIDSDDFLDAPKALREYAKKLKSQLDATAKERNELRTTVTANALSDVLADFKNPERVKRDLLADKIDPLDKSKVDEWLTANGDDYAKGQERSTPEPNADEGEVQAHQQLQAAASGMRTPADMTKVDTFTGEITKEMTGAEIIALAQKHGL